MVDDGIRALEEACLPTVRRRRDTPFGEQDLEMLQHRDWIAAS